MVIHYIILSSSYSTHTRIALHRPYISAIDYSEVDPIVSRIEGCFGGATVQIGVHIMQTQSEDWESVVEEDPYFKGVKKIDSVDEFIRLIKMDEFLTGMDVAKYILKTTPCTHTRINKLTYMCYADYLCKTGRRMFKDDIYAFRYGPVVETVYKDLREYCQQHSGKAFMYVDEQDETEGLDDIDEMSISSSRMSVRSRLMFAANGADIVRSVDETVKRYSKVSTDELVSMTHRKRTPWSLTDRSSDYAKISDELIKEYHHNETSPYICPL